jgi:SAM-dependent methyltransferase
MTHGNTKGMANGFYATIARYYDAEHHDKEEDLPFYSDLAEDYGDPILVIGGGTGRVMLHLAEQSYTVHGIESERAMLERAQRKLDTKAHLKSNVTFHAGSALDIKLNVAAKTTIIPYNTLMHFHTQDEQIALLRRARQWTQPGGVLAIDLPNAADAFGSMDSSAVTLERTFLEPDSGHMVMQHSVSELDRTEQLMYVTWIYDEIGEDGTVHRTVAPVVNRYFFFSELKLLLATCGFNDVLIYGDFDYTPFVDGCPRMIVLAK